jgi:toxin ParE1/3/4
MSRRYILSPRAEVDLDEIWDFTVKMWGEKQAEDYIRLLVGAIETVAENPRRGRPCDEVRKGYRQYLAGSHIIFFRKIKSGFDVIRILHGRMDFEQHL